MPWGIIDGGKMIKVKTFTSEIKVFQTVREIGQLDDKVNGFLAESGIKKVISVSDACTTDNTGATIGIIRVVTYDDGR
jgi:hypothetical protein